MNRRRSTPYAILGLLSVEPMSGYDIRKAAAESVGHFWSESFGQIYPALRELTRARLVRRRTERQAGPVRHVHEITARGRATLARWLLEPPRVAPIRSELLLKLFFGGRASTQAHLAWLEGMLEEATAQLATFRGIEQRMRRETPEAPHLPHWRITVRYGVHRAEAHQRWAREAIATLRAAGAGARARSGRRAAPARKAASRA